MPQKSTGARQPWHPSSRGPWLFLFIIAILLLWKLLLPNCHFIKIHVGKWYVFKRKFLKILNFDKKSGITEACVERLLSLPQFVGKFKFVLFWKHALICKTPSFPLLKNSTNLLSFRVPNGIVFSCLFLCIYVTILFFRMLREKGSEQGTLMLKTFCQIS